jgi:ABC-type glycerol-3-phosphate transport system substrate-binding protein
MKLDVIPLPKIDGTSGHESAWYNVGFMCQAQQTKYAQQAGQLISFLSTKDVQQRYVITGVDLVPAMKDVTPKNLDPVVAKYLTFIPEGIGPTVSTHWPDVKLKMLQAAQAVISGQKTAKQSLDEFASTINPELDGN